MEIANIHTSPTEDEIQNCDHIFEDSVITPASSTVIFIIHKQSNGSASGPLLPGSMRLFQKRLVLQPPNMHV